MPKASAATSVKLSKKGSKEPQKYALITSMHAANTHILWHERAKGPSAAANCGLKYTCA